MDQQSLKKEVRDRQVQVRLLPTELQEVKSFAERHDCTVADVFRYSVTKLLSGESAQNQQAQG